MPSGPLDAGARQHEAAGPGGGRPARGARRGRPAAGGGPDQPPRETGPPPPDVGDHRRDVGRVFGGKPEAGNHAAFAVRRCVDRYDGKAAAAEPLARAGQEIPALRIGRRHFFLEIGDALAADEQECHRLRRRIRHPQRVALSNARPGRDVDRLRGWAFQKISERRTSGDPAGRRSAEGETADHRGRDHSGSLPRAMAATPVRATSIKPSGSISLMKALILSVDPVISKTNESIVESIARARKMSAMRSDSTRFSPVPRTLISASSRSTCPWASVRSLTLCTGTRR